MKRNEWIYAMWDCDGQKSIKSIDARFPLAMTTSFRKFCKAVAMKSGRSLKDVMKMDISEMNDILDYYYVDIFENNVYTATPDW